LKQLHLPSKITLKFASQVVSFKIIAGREDSAIKKHSSKGLKTPILNKRWTFAFGKFKGGLEFDLTVKVG